MRGKRRTKTEKNELFGVLELYLEMGYSIKKACVMCSIPYSTIRDSLKSDEVLRAKVNILNNRVSTKARQNLIESINKGNVPDSKWWIDRFDTDLRASDDDLEVSDEQKPVSDNRIVFVDFSGTPEQLERYEAETRK